jgi:hypothetical protein
MGDLIKEFWGLIIAAVGAVAFIIRMEQRTSFHGIELERLQRQRDADMAAAQRSRDETHRMLHDMDAKLDRLIERQMK